MVNFIQILERIIFALPNFIKGIYYSKTLELRDNAYWDKKKKDKNPICSKCIEDNRKKIHLTKKNNFRTTAYFCSCCKNEFSLGMEPSSPPQRNEDADFFSY